MSPGVFFPLVHDLPEGNLEDIFVAEVIDVHLRPSGPDPLGRLRSGSILISGHIRKTDRPLMAVYDDGWVKHVDWLDFRERRQNADQNSEMYFLLLTLRVSRYHNGAREIRSVKGLILRKSVIRASLYYRVGMFHHDWRQEHLEGTSVFPLFVDFDPNRCERVTVMII